MISKTLFFVLSVITLLLSNPTFAGDEELTLRLLPNGSYEAVLSLNSSICVQVNPASSVQVDGFNILVVSPTRAQLPCIFIPPITYYEMTALVGELAPGKYSVTWDQPENFSWSTTYIVKGPGAIPSSSTWSLILLVLGVFVVAGLTFRLKSIQ